VRSKRWISLLTLLIAGCLAGGLVWADSAFGERTVSAQRTGPAADAAVRHPGGSASPAASPAPAPVLPADLLTWPDAPQSAVEVGGGALVEHGAQQSVPIASVAKVMTAYVVLADHPLAPGADGPVITVTAQDAADYAYDATHDQATVEVRAGEQLTERQALDELLLHSANNVAYLLARWDRGTVPAFLGEMNAAGARLGLTGTVYTDPSGLEPSTVSTAADQVRLAEAALAVPAFAGLVDTVSATVPLVGTLENPDSLLGTNGIAGVKTGYTSQAGGTMVIAAWSTYRGRQVLIIGCLLGVPPPGATTGARTFEGGDRLIVSAEQALSGQ
jgi:serine-type D-Ala-D-Ala carboxypeptidase (penicillin-binding protein 5/6)